MRSWQAIRESNSAIRSTSAVGALAGVMLMAAVSSSCASTGTVVAFKGRCTDSNGRGISSFTFSIGRQGDAERPPVSVKTTNGQYVLQVRVAGIAAPLAGTQGRQTLGTAAESVTIQIAAPGYKTKTFTVPANQIFVSEPNTLNVVLVPTS